MQTMVQLTEELVRRLDQLAARDGSSRSQLIREAVAVYLAEHESQRRVDRFVAGYAEQPETEAELETARANARSLVAEEPW
jgi:metal-responsive CopG/Arc/MetJ family transcriptional regulator